MTTLFSCLAFLSVLGWLYLALFRGRFWRPVLAQASVPPDAWPSVDIIVPARDEAEVLPGSLPSLLAQDYPGAWKIILVDDHSADGTADLAERLAKSKNAGERLAVIKAPDLPEGWNGKLAAMNAGVAQSRADYILFTDADILHSPDSLRGLAARAMEFKFDLVSRMVELHCESFAEKLLIPAFVFFFAMLYPFSRVNDPDSETAAAAGGVMLVKRKALDNIGGLARIKSQLIDDCALARAIKDSGGEKQTEGRIELALAEDIQSLRAYPAVSDVGRMVARTAYAQLNYSPLWLAATLCGMSLLFLVPPLLLVFAPLSSALAGLATWLAMTILYIPMIQFYRLNAVWAFMLPAAAVIYLGATIDSARLYWQGKGGQWKGRMQAQ